MVLETAKAADYKAYKRLLLSAFPPEERPPYFLLRGLFWLGKGSLLIARDNGKFIGFLHLVCYADIIYLFFFAVEEAYRGQGYGSKILQLLKTQNPNKRILIAREPLDNSADNCMQRQKRWEFYKKNGFSDMSMKIIEKGYVFDTMSIGGTVSAEEYHKLIASWCGKLLQKYMDMHATQ